MTKFKSAIAIAVGTLFAGAAFAQSNYSIEQRDRNQDRRIEQGIESRQLTGREANRLEREQGQVERIERRARADGVLTQYERARIDRAQDRFGRDIYRESRDRQAAHSNWRTSDRPQGWDRRNEGWNRRNDNDQRHFNHGVRSEQFNHREAVRGERNDWRANGAATRSGTGARFGRSDLAPGRQPHFQQTEVQRTHVQQGQTQRSWTRPAQTSSTGTAAGTGAAASPAVQQAQTQRSWTRTARTSTTGTAANPVQQAQTQRSRTRSAQTSSPATTASPVTVARQGGYSGHRSR